MRGHAVYFFMLKDDLIESFKRVEEKLGGLQYVVHTFYDEPKFEIFDSIEKITDIGLIKPIRTNYFIALKNGLIVQCGSPGQTRTDNLEVNSFLLHH